MTHAPETLAELMRDALQAAHHPADVVADLCDPAGPTVRSLQNHLANHPPRIRPFIQGELLRGYVVIFAQAAAERAQAARAAS